MNNDDFVCLFAGFLVLVYIFDYMIVYLLALTIFRICCCSRVCYVSFFMYYTYLCINVLSSTKIHIHIYLYMHEHIGFLL